jgi:NADPH:quinone reductase-like Zn-dependent oxidoreductase
MKAIFYKQHGGAEKLQYGDRPVPVPKPGEVLVRLKAAALNHLDIWVRNGLPGLTVPMPHIPGSDGAGVVEKTAKDVKGVDVGARVMLAPGVSCGKCDACESGEDQLCPHFDILGQARDGTYAEYVAVPAENLVPIPEGIDFVQAAAFPLVFLTAWRMVVSLAQVRSGETVLVHAGGSGVGTAAIQVAKLWGAEVFTTVGDDAKTARVKALGADHVINYQKKDFLHEVRQLTDKRGVDVVVEHVGPAVFEKSLLALARGGRLVTCGATTGRQAPLDLRLFYSRHLRVIGTRLGPKRDLLEAARFFAAGKLKPVLDRTFPLRLAAQAQAHMESRKLVGKIVLEI